MQTSQDTFHYDAVRTRLDDFQIRYDLTKSELDELLRLIQPEDRWREQGEDGYTGSKQSIDAQIAADKFSATLEEGTTYGQLLATLNYLRGSAPRRSNPALKSTLLTVALPDPKKVDWTDPVVMITTSSANRIVDGREFDYYRAGPAGRGTLGELKWDYVKVIKDGNEAVKAKLEDQGTKQREVAKAHGQRLEWTVPDAYLAAFKAAVGKENAEFIDWKTYSLKEARSFLKSYR